MEAKETYSGDGGGGGGGRRREIIRDEGGDERTRLTASHPTHRPSPHHRGRAASVRWACGRGWGRGLVLCCLWVLLATPANTCAETNGCDFYGSGLEQDGRGVQPVYLSCSSGRVEWQYPRAGLRVILRSPHKTRDFRACIRGDAGFQGARIYLEGHRSLLPLFAADDGRPRELVRCFSSYRGQAALYVEAEPSNDDLKKQVAGFEYDLQTLPKDELYDPMEECRPCSEEEMLRLYCSGDFVARGRIVTAEDRPDLATTSITVRATKLFQQTSAVFRHKKTSSSSKSSSFSSSSSYAWGEDTNVVEDEGGYVGHLAVPLQCGARSGEGEFVVMGVMRLGQPILRCAPRHEEWVRIARNARTEAQCVLET